MASKEYQPIDQIDRTTESDIEGTEHRRQARRFPLQTCILSFLLLLSGITNLVLFTSGNRQAESQGYVPGLLRNVPVPIPHDNRTLDDELWDDPRLNTFTGLVALDETFVQDHALDSSQKWPWDSSKSIYMLHGFHSLHCVMMLRRTIIDVRDGNQLFWTFKHITHCLHVLREDIMCYADDFPRYTGRLHAETGQPITSSGTGSIRKCRNWDHLRQFALDNSACYSRPLYSKSRVLDRYKSCPDGSKPWEKLSNSK